MSFIRRLLGLGSKSVDTAQRKNEVAQAVEDSFRHCRFETMEERRVLSASPLVVGAVYIEGDGGTDAEPDQFYISYQGGSATTAVTRIVIDGNQDGAPTMGATDVYFDTVSNSDPGNVLGVGDAHEFQFSNKSTGISAGEVSATVTDGGTRLVLDLVGFEAGDVLAFTIDVDQFFSSKPHDQVTSGIEFAGSSLEITANDSDYTFNPDPTISYATFEYSFDFGSDGIDDTGVLSGLPSELNRTSDNGFNSIENRTAGARKDFTLVPRPVSISGHVGLSDEDGNCIDPLSTSYQGVGGVLITAQDAAGNIFTTHTNSNGFYEFTDLAPGTYTITETQPTDLLDGSESVGTVNGLTTGSQGTNDQFTSIVLNPGDEGINYNFCEHLPASVKGTVFYDRNDNGIQDAGENGIAGATVELLDSSGNFLALTLTDADGEYCFENLAAGTYSVRETQPAPYLDGKDSVGTINGVITGSMTNDRLNNIVLRPGEQGIEYNFGEIREAIIEGQVLTDLNANCILDPALGERPLSNVLIQLLDSNQNVIDQVHTDADGRYRFDGLRPGSYSVKQIQPGNYFTVGETIGTFNYTGSPGDGVTSENLISDITIYAGAHMLDYNFCEAPAAVISGYVFQDGDAVSVKEGETLTPSQAKAVRDGQLTPDDRRLPGVVLELRDGITGLAIDASTALPGTYPAGAIRTTTDANGFYEFTGLRQGNYAVFEVQPAGFQDHIDTQGTNQGVPVNPTDSINPFILSTLDASVNPANDAILRIAVNWGDNAQLNNFSEILTTSEPDVPINPPPTPRVPVPQIPPTFVVGGSVHGSGGPAPNSAIAGLSSPPSGGLGFTWHLSVINAGNPRGDRAIETQWKNISYLSEANWNAVDMTRGVWHISQENISEIGQTPSTQQVTYGMENAIPLAGDFNGDGTDELLMYSGGKWFVDMNGNMVWDRDDLWAELGTEADLPVVGDWDGDGKDDIGIYGPHWANDLRSIDMEPGLPDLANNMNGQAKNLPPNVEDAADGVRTLKHKSNGKPRTDLIDHVFRYGTKEELPVTGDWNGDGVRNIGTFKDGRWQLDLDGDGRLTANDEVRQFGREGDIPVVGDFDGDGIEQLGVFRGGTWIIDSNSNGELDSTDKVFELGTYGDIPVVGDFDGDGIDEPSVYRQTDPSASSVNLKKAG